MNDYATALASHEYDVTLYGVFIGKDPDVYAYWHSSQADIRSNNRLNLSEWNNVTASTAIEAGRSRQDTQLRTAKYVPFFQAWQQEAPALGLYQPRYLYLSREKVYGLTERSISSGVDRYNGVEQWKIRTAKVTQ
jgi:peptide/nickel transport system substrate-binding protein